MMYTKKMVKEMVVKAVREGDNIQFVLYSLKDGEIWASKYTFGVFGGDFKVFNASENRVEDIKSVFKFPLYRKEDADAIIEENKLNNRIKKIEEIFNF